MKLVLGDDHLNNIRRHGQATYPEEGGGLLLGRFDDGQAVVREVRVLPNTWEMDAEKRRRYLIPSRVMLREEREADARGLDVVGYFHSHPDHPAIPSEFDRDHALPNWSYVIVSVHDGQAREVLAWQLREDRSAFDQQEMTNVEGRIMNVNVVIPTPLRQYADGQKTVAVRGATVGQALDALTAAHPELKRHLFSEDGRLRSFVNVYLGDEDVRYLKQDETPLADGATLSIVPSVAGGVQRRR